MATVVAQCYYQIDYAYSDTGKELKVTDDHTFVKACKRHGIGQQFTRINRSKASHPITYGDVVQLNLF